MTSKASHQLTKAGGHDGASQALYSHSQLLLICAKKETHCSQPTMALTLSSFKQSTKTTTASSPLLGARLSEVFGRTGLNEASALRIMKSGKITASSGESGGLKRGEAEALLESRAEPWWKIEAKNLLTIPFVLASAAFVCFNMTIAFLLEAFVMRLYDGPLATLGVSSASFVLVR